MLHHEETWASGISLSVQSVFFSFCASVRLPGGFSWSGGQRRALLVADSCQMLFLFYQDILLTRHDASSDHHMW